jgi:hypothetical protein
MTGAVDLGAGVHVLCDEDKSGGEAVVGGKDRGERESVAVRKYDAYR